MHPEERRLRSRITFLVLWNRYRCLAGMGHVPEHEEPLVEEVLLEQWEAISREPERLTQRIKKFWRSKRIPKGGTIPELREFLRRLMLHRAYLRAKAPMHEDD